MDTINVLITNVSYQASTSFIKMLRTSNKYKCRIYGCDTIPKGLSSGSILVDYFEHIPFQSSESEYINIILSICERFKIDLVISAEENDLVLFKKHRISCSYYDSIVSPELIELFNDKHHTNTVMNSIGLTIPKTIITKEEFQKSRCNKFIQRKRVSCCSRGITYFDCTQLDEHYIFYNDEYITQECVIGDMYTIDVLCDSYGIPKMIIPRISLSSKDGTTFKCVFDKNRDLINICQQVYTKFKIPGFSNIQFIVHDSVPYFIELNPRAAATVIASSLISTNWMDLYIDNYVKGVPMPEYNKLMSCVQWNTIISRYYQETMWRNEYERADFAYNK